jgi:quinol-cytochrome oxidoreductase complex cytochrome b subunit
MSSPLTDTYNSLKQWLKIRLNPSPKDISFFKQPFVITLLKTLCIVLILQCISGILLSMYFIPSKSPIISSNGVIQEYVRSDRSVIDAEGDTIAVEGQYYVRNATKNSIRPTQSFYSVQSIIYQSSIGKIIHTFHTFNNHLLIVICLILPILAVFYKFIHSEHAFIWHMWWLFSSIIFIISWTGYILPWTQYSATSYAIVTGILEYHADWLGGNIITNILGKNSEDSIARLFTLHSILLPALLIIFGKIYQKKLREYVQVCISSKYFGIYTFILMMFAYIFSFFVRDNIPADAFLTKIESLKPEWIFLPYHGIIQSLPTDASIMVIVLSIIALGYIPYMSSHYKQKIWILLLFSILIFSALMSYS